MKRAYLLLILAVAVVFTRFCAPAFPEEAAPWVCRLNDESGEIIVAIARAGDEDPDFSPITAPILLGVGESIAIDAPRAYLTGFASSQEAVARVDEDGAVLAVKPGRATVRTYFENEEYADVEIQVKSAPTGVKLAAKKGTMKLGDAFRLGCTLSNNSAGALFWYSSDEGVVSVNEEGMLTAAGVGECVVTVETYNGHSAQCRVTVVMPEPAKVRLSAYKGKMYEGETYALEATLDGGYRETVDWTSSAPDVLTVDESGVLTAITVGTAVVRAQASGGNYSNCVVEVLPGSTGISANAHEMTLYTGGTGNLTARVTGGSGKYSLVSMNLEVAVIDEATGSILAVGEGEATIRAVTPNGAYDACALTVLAAPEPFALTAGARAIAKTETLQTFFSADALPVRYESSNKNIVSVDVSGLLTGVGIGKATIRATAGGRAADLEIEVQPIATGITLSAGAGVLGVGDRYTLICTLTGGAGSVAYESSDPSVVTVDGNTGEVTAVGEGTAKVAATLKNGRRAVCDIRVAAAPQSISLSYEQIALGAGDQIALSYRLNEGARGSVSWASSDERLVTVDENGLVVSCGVQGVATVTARTHNGLEASARISVIDPPNEFLVNATYLVPGGKFDAYLQIPAGQEKSLETVCEGYTRVSISYASTQPFVATVDESGRICALSQGTTLITARAYTGEEIVVLVEVA